MPNASPTISYTFSSATLLGEGSLESDLRRARRLAYLFDARFELAGFRFGLDAIVGLIPVVGDTLTTLAGVFPLWIAHRHQLGNRLKIRMASNLLLDWAIGLLPFVGDLADIGFKAHLRNLKLLEKACEKRTA